ncbi:MAG TPA: NADH-quinone oxidoreductase subunit H, partial [Polyangiales bacterium]
MDAIAIIAMLAKIVFVLAIVLTFSPVLVWADRRQSAMIQDRMGPNRAGIPFGNHGGSITLVGL